MATKSKIKEFIAYWKNKGDEKQHTQKFWLMFVRDILNVDNPEKYLEFEERLIAEKSTKYADIWIPSTKVMIEQKSSDISLDTSIKQSDGTFKTPFEQAQEYSNKATYDKRPRWIVVCNFVEFRIHDMNLDVRKRVEPIITVKLEELEAKYNLFDFLINEQVAQIHEETQLSIKAGELVGNLYDVLSKQYKDINNESSRNALNKLIVRLVFCLYSEDAGLFGKKNAFHDYLKEDENSPKNFRRALIDLFDVLNTPENKRDDYLDDDLAAFPYVNGGLFADDHLEIPQFTQEIIEEILYDASEGFDWSQISPTIFGAVFESTLNPETRRSGGMHYTSIENIHKVIDPLFLDDLKNEFNELKKEVLELSDRARQATINKIDKKIDDFKNKLSNLKFLDPACGSGNFLTETYISLRKLENQCIELYQSTSKKISENQLAFGFEGHDHDLNLIKVSLNQFYGIEINDFAVAVAQCAMWIAESQMLQETENILNDEIEFFPLKSFVNIKCGNALRINWNDVVPKEELNHIMGNPPYLGASIMSKIQKKDVIDIFDKIKKSGDLDYVAAWYKKAADYIQKTNISCAFVSTNSICQGEQPNILWKHLFENGVVINFAYPSFVWDNETFDMAHVHCVIVGFAIKSENKKTLYYNDGSVSAKNINGYLLDSDNVFIESFSKPLSKVEKMIRGSSPCDNGNYSFTYDEKEKFVSRNPSMKKYIRNYIGSREFINNVPRYCLWLYGANPKDIANSSDTLQLINNVREFRNSRTKVQTVKLAETPTIWEANRYNGKDFILIPRVSSERRKYIPIGFINGETIANDSVQLIPNATIYEFGVLTSNVHNAWMRRVAGRLESRYRYSNLVYNSFVWCEPTAEHKTKIEQSAQAILDARALYPNSSLADLYDPLLMPIELRKAHEANDKAVMKAYGFKPSMSEDEIIAELFKMYKELVDEKK